jgi:hypothetical protein
VIAGVAVLLFGGVLLGVGIHHMIRTGTCSSTGYSANYGPVPTCPPGTGWWFAFLFGGIILGIVGGVMTASGTSMSISPIFFGIFGGIGFGALSLLIDSKASSGTKVFGGVFGGCFAVVGLGAGWAMLSAAIKAMNGTAGSGSSSSSSSISRSSLARGSLATMTGAPRVVSNAFRSSPAAAPSRSAPSGADTDALEQVAKLADLHKSGALTDEEFAMEKAKLLGTL